MRRISVVGILIGATILLVGWFILPKLKLKPIPFEQPILKTSFSELTSLSPTPLINSSSKLKIELNKLAPNDYKKDSDELQSEIKNL